MELADLQKTIDVWIKKYGVRYFDEMTNLGILMEEVGEVARVMTRRFGEQSEKEPDKRKDLADELADVIFVAVCIANQTGIDLEEAMQRNLDKKTNRDSERHLNNDKLK
ncbi:MAG: NTP pyrophosphatase (non-canonical NTP hydrolase) [Psychromonas sp.]|jgi:NTP pyrophosphatase (non-canonical NTP hydrolase)